MKTRKPTAVLIADIHFSLSTLEEASLAFKQAANMAIDLSVPLIVAGDLTDGKAIIRGEVANCLIRLFSLWGANTQVLVGNHDKLNEKGDEDALHFLNPYTTIIRTTTFNQEIGGWLIPYQSSPEAFRRELSNIVQESLIICHQGVQGAHMGSYVMDKTSLPMDTFQDYRVISGHYHRAQDIKCGRPRLSGVGLFSYVGNPYTLSFGEAGDGMKGFQVLYSDGLMVQVPILNIRRHIIIETTNDQLFSQKVNKSAILWFKVHGPFSELQKIKKKDVAQQIVGHMNFKLDLIPNDSRSLEQTERKTLTGEEIFDKLIEMLPEKPEQKAYLKTLWREVLQNA